MSQMLPVVVIGADDSVRAAFEAWPGYAVFYDSAEDAEFGLNDLNKAAGNTVERDDKTGHWRCTVVYGPKVLGLFATGQDPRLAHDGWTVLADSNIRDDQQTPRRVRDHQVEGEPAQTMVWEAMTRARPHFVVDVALAGGVASIGALRDALSVRSMP